MATPAANSLRYTFLPSLLPALPPNLDGEVAFVVNGVSQGTMAVGTPFTTTSLQDFVDLGIEYSETAANAALPEYGNNNLILQAKAFYDLAGEGARAHWLVLDGGFDTEDTPMAINTFTDIFGGTQSTNLMAALARQAQYQIRILGVSFSHRRDEMIDDPDSADPADMIYGPNRYLLTAAQVPITGSKDPQDDRVGNFAGGLTHADITTIEENAAYWEEMGMPFLSLIHISEPTRPY